MVREGCQVHELEQGLWRAVDTGEVFLVRGDSTVVRGVGNAPEGPTIGPFLRITDDTNVRIVPNELNWKA